MNAEEIKTLQSAIDTINRYKPLIDEIQSLEGIRQRQTAQLSAVVDEKRALAVELERVTSDYKRIENELAQLTGVSSTRQLEMKILACLPTISKEVEQLRELSRAVHEAARICFEHKDCSSFVRCAFCKLIDFYKSMNK